MYWILEFPLTLQDVLFHVLSSGEFEGASELRSDGELHIPKKKWAARWSYKECPKHILSFLWRKIIDLHGLFE